MSDADRIKWDSKYAAARTKPPPSDLLTRFTHLAIIGRALDLACGLGQNTLFLAGLGFHVDAVDISQTAIDRLANVHPRVTALCRDLDSWQIPVGQYQLIANIRFLDRRLFPMIQDGLSENGLLVFESFISDRDDPYCLRPGELRSAFPDLTWLFYEETELPETARFPGQVSCVAQKIATGHSM